MSEMQIFVLCTLFFVLLGFAIPLIQSEFNVSITANFSPSSTNINWYTLSVSILSMFVWSFGSIPLWLDLCIFLPLRIFWIVTAKKLFFST